MPEASQGFGTFCEFMNNYQKVKQSVSCTFVLKMDNPNQNLCYEFFLFIEFIFLAQITPKNNCLKVCGSADCCMIETRTNLPNSNEFLFQYFVNHEMLQLKPL